MRFSTKLVQVKQLPAMDENHKQWDAVVKAIETGSYTIDQVKSKYSLTPEVEAVLTSLKSE